MAEVIRAVTNLHCPKCGNDIVTIIKTVPIETIRADNRPLKCYWPKCYWEGKICDVVPKETDTEDDPCQPCHNALCCLDWAKTEHKAKCDNWDYFKKHYASGLKKIIGAEILQAGGDGQ